MCTSILLRYPGGTVLGRNMDYEYPLRYNALYLPRGYEYAKDLYGNPLISDYAMMGVCFENRDPLKDGVNEHGLMGCTNAFSLFRTFLGEVDPEKRVNLSSLDYFNYALGKYKDVEELLSDLENMHISTRNSEGEEVICPGFHYFFVDQKGRSIVIEPRKGILEALENPYDVLTNSPALGTHERRLKKMMDPGKLGQFNAAKDLPGGYDPISRFIKAFYLTKTHIGPEDSLSATESAYSILEALKMPRGFVKLKGNPDHSYTRYICVYENQNPRLTVRSHRNTKLYSLEFKELEGSQRRAIDFDGPLEMESLIDLC